MRQFLTFFAALLFFAASSRAEGAYSRSVVAKSILRTATTSSGAKLDFPKSDSGEVAGLEVTIPAGQGTGWHKHGHSGFAYVLSGHLQVVLQDSTRKDFGPGEAFAEVVGLAHDGRAIGKEDVRLVAFFLADKGKPVSEKVVP